MKFFAYFLVLFSLVCFASNKDIAPLKPLHAERTPNPGDDRKEHDLKLLRASRNNALLQSEDIQAKKSALVDPKERRLLKDKELAQLCKVVCHLKRLPEDLQAKIFDFAQELTVKHTFSTYLPQQEDEDKDEEEEENEETIEFYNPLHCDIVTHGSMQYATIDYRGTMIAGNYLSISYPIAHETEDAFPSKFSGFETSAVCPQGPLISGGTFDDGGGIGVRHIVSENADHLKKHVLKPWDLKWNQPLKNGHNHTMRIEFEYDENIPRIQLFSHPQHQSIIAVAVNKKFKLFALAPSHDISLFFSSQFPEYINNFTLYHDSGLKMVMACGRSAHIFDFASNKFVADAGAKELVFSGESAINQIAVYHDKGLYKAAITTDDGSLHLWNLTTGSVEFVFEKIAVGDFKVMLIKDGEINKLAIADSRSFSIVDLGSGKFCLDRVDFDSDAGRIHHLTSFQEGKNRKFIICSEDGAMLLDYEAGIFEQAFAMRPASNSCAVL